MKNAIQKSAGRPHARPGISIHDVLYVLFKHKWKILVVAGVGFLAAGAVYYRASKSPSYESRATLLVRYVL